MRKGVIYAIRDGETKVDFAFCRKILDAGGVEGTLVP